MKTRTNQVIMHPDMHVYTGEGGSGPSRAQVVHVRGGQSQGKGSCLFLFLLLFLRCRLGDPAGNDEQQLCDSLDYRRRLERVRERTWK